MHNDNPRENSATLKRPRFVWFDGLLQGPLANYDAIRAAVDRLNGEGGAELQIETEGSRMSFMLSDRVIMGARIVGDCREQFVGSLNRILVLIPNIRQFESTLRCTEVFEDEVRESLFDIRGGEIACLSRVRPPEPSDLSRVSQTGFAPREPVPWGRIIIIGVLTMTAFGLAAWQSGWVDRAFSAASRSLIIDPGPFLNIIDAEVKDSWGEYTIILRRGRDYPRTREQSGSFSAAASSPVGIAAAAAVTSGNNIYLRLETLEGDVLESTEVSLRELLTKDEIADAATLHGRMAARRLVIGLDAGRKHR
ncbi:MAG: hypothetical protein HY286_09465 [Planctomycetes bacterium]|nr:hypothetical protein [Planctomycetota bacterium]